MLPSCGEFLYYILQTGFTKGVFNRGLAYYNEVRRLRKGVTFLHTCQTAHNLFSKSMVKVNIVRMDLYSFTLNEGEIFEFVHLAVT